MASPGNSVGVAESAITSSTPTARLVPAASVIVPMVVSTPARFWRIATVALLVATPVTADGLMREALTGKTLGWHMLLGTTPSTVTIAAPAAACAGRGAVTGPM